MVWNSVERLSMFLWIKLNNLFNLTFLSLCCASLSSPLICLSSFNSLKVLFIHYFSSFFPHSTPRCKSPKLLFCYSISLSPCSALPLPSLYFPHLFANSLSHSHLIIPPSQLSFLSFSIPLLHFHHSSLRELIASSFVLGEQRETMAKWGLSLWQQAWDKREGGKETKKKGRERKNKHRGDAGC